MIDHEKIEQAVRLLLEGMGEDVNREGLIDTPDRIARMLTGFTFSFSTALAGIMIIASKSRKANVFFMCFNLIMYNKFFY